MKLLLFQAKQFYWKSFSKTLETVPDQDVTETVPEAMVVFLHAEAEDEARPGLETKAVKNIKWLANKHNLKMLYCTLSPTCPARPPRPSLLRRC